MLKECRNLDCKNNKNGYCTKIDSPRSTYDILTKSQWISLRKKQEQRKKHGLKPRKNCLNDDCINNIDHGCYLPSESMVLAEINDKQWTELMCQKHTTGP